MNSIYIGDPFTFHLAALSDKNFDLLYDQIYAKLIIYPSAATANFSTVSINGGCGKYYT